MSKQIFGKSAYREYPWKHLIIDNFFPDFSEIENAAKSLQGIYSNEVISANKCLSLFEVYHDIGKKAFDLISNQNIFLLENIENLVADFPNSRKFENYVSIPSFHILPPETPWQKIHDEAYDKTASIVVYLYPNESDGTTLYQKNDRNSENIEVEWKQNTAMLFCGEKGVTWHDFRSTKNPRVTLNFFLRTQNDSDSFEENGDYYEIKFGNGLPTYIPKNLPKNILNLWFKDYYKRKVVW